MKTNRSLEFALYNTRYAFYFLFFSSASESVLLRLKMPLKELLLLILFVGIIMTLGLTFPKKDGLFKDIENSSINTLLTILSIILSYTSLLSYAFSFWNPVLFVVAYLLGVINAFVILIILKSKAWMFGIPTLILILGAVSGYRYNSMFNVILLGLLYSFSSYLLRYFGSNNEEIVKKETYTGD